MRIVTLSFCLCLLICLSCTGFTHPFSDERKMQSLLVRAEEMNRNEEPMDSILFMPEVLDFYLRQGTNENCVRAYYMMGCVFRDRGNSPQSLEYFQEAVIQADTLFSNQLLLSHIFRQMALIYQEQRIPQKEIDQWKHCRDCALKAKDSLLAVQALDYISSAYYEVGNLDSSLVLANQVYNEYKELGREDYAATSLLRFINYYLDQDDLPKAKEALDEYQAKSGHFLDNESEKGFELIYYYMGIYEERLQNLHLAQSYFRRLANATEDISNLSKSYHGLMSVYAKLEQTDSVLKYAELYTQANDSANVLNSANEIHRAEMLYDFTENQQVARKKSDEANRLWRIFYLVLLGLIGMSIIISFCISRHRRKQRQDLSLLNQRYNGALNRYLEAVQSLKLQEISFSDLVLAKENELKELRRVLMNYQENEGLDNWDVQKTLFNHEIVQRLHMYAVQMTAPTDCEWKDFQEVVEKLLPEFYLHLSQLSRDLSEKEFRVCMLTRLRFIPSEIAVLLGLSKQRVTNIRGAINKKLFHQEGAKNMSQNLNQL